MGTHFRGKHHYWGVGDWHASEPGSDCARHEFGRPVSSLVELWYLAEVWGWAGVLQHCWV